MHNDLEIWLSKADLNGEERKKIINETLRQVKKDFALQGIELETDSLNIEELVYSFSSLLDQLEFLHNPKLPSLLYQLDLKEAEISHKLTTSKPELTYKVLSESILKRCFEKVMWRRKFQSRK